MAANIIWIVALLIIVFVSLFFIRRFYKASELYRGILNSLPFPVTVTDMNRSWVFINTAVENVLGKKFKDVKGKQCSSWGAGICKTPKCGIEALYKGKKETQFTQWGLHFKVNTEYVLDSKGRKIGHTECVSNISDIVGVAQKLGELFVTLPDTCNGLVKDFDSMSKNVDSLLNKNTQQKNEVDSLLHLSRESQRELGETVEQINVVRSDFSASSETIDSNKVHMASLMNVIGEISENSKQITQIVDEIQGVANQTNLLALNAAIEAARAGELGKGFAVVADEVRKLANRSSEAAQNTSVLIGTSIKSIAQGTQFADIVASSMTQVVEKTQASVGSIAEMSRQIDEQAATMNQMVSSNVEMSEAIAENIANSGELVESLQHLSERINELNRMIDGFTAVSGDLKAYL